MKLMVIITWLYFFYLGYFIPDVDAEKLLTPQEIIDYMSEKYDFA